MFQSRRSLLVWKLFGQRLDGWTNDDLPTETIPGDADTLEWHGEAIANTPYHRSLADLDYTGSIMPPPEAVEGFMGPDGKQIKVQPLTDEDRLTIVRWIDLGCPIETDLNQTDPAKRSYGWMCDDNRPTLTLTYPAAGANAELSRLLIGMHDYSSGLDMDSFHVTADFPVPGFEAGSNLAPLFSATAPGVWELKLDEPIERLLQGRLTVAVKDRQGNLTRIERTFSVGPRAGE
jgi:hypothetical protein